MERVVDVENLVKRFDQFTAVDQLTFSVNKGEIFGFLGPNGAGKSTTIKMLCGILMPTGGSGHVFGLDIMKDYKSIKKVIGYMSQKFSLYDDLTVLENLEFYGCVYDLSGKKLKDRIEAVLKMSEITADKKLLVKNLPAGIKQRLALGNAVLHDPPLLFLDEPTSGVDPIMRRNFWALIYEFAREGKTIFVSTHYMDEAEHCNRIALIIAGKMMALDSPDNLKHSLLEDVYALKIPNFISVFEKLSDLPFIKEVSIFGSDIHMLCEKGYPLEKELSGYLEKLNLRNYQLEKILPSLEDVFVTKVRKNQSEEEL